MSTLQTTVLKHPDSATNNIQFDSAGLVGVGAAPTRPLTVSSSAGATNILGVFNNSGTSASNCVIAFSDPTSTQGQFSTRIGSFGDGLKFYTNGSNEALEISSDGNVLLTRDSDVRIELGTNGTTATNDRNHLRADGDNLKYNTCENGQHIFEQNGLDAMRIDGNGKLVVGATSFNSGANSFTQAMVSGTDGGLIINSTNTSAGSYARLIFTPNGHITGNEGLVRYNTNDYHMAFLTTGNERMRIDSVGHCTHYRNTTTLGVGLLQCNSDVGGSNRAQWYVISNGSVENRTGSYGTIASDERVKKDIVDATSQWEDIKNIKMRKFRYKTDGDDSQLQLGVIAQELEVVCPNLVTRKPATAEMSDESGGLIAEGEDILSWKQSIVHLKALKALQEAMERIEQLETKVAALEAG